MKTNFLILVLILAMSNLMGQALPGEYFITGQGGEIVLVLKSTGANTLGGTLTDMQGLVYQVNAVVEEGEDAFGTLQSQQSGMYFEAYRENELLMLTLIPAGQDGQPDNSGAKEFTMQARAASATMNTPQVGGKLGKLGGLSGPLAGQTASATNWSGTFSGNLQGTPTTLQIQSQGTQLSGIIDAAGYKYQMNGQINNTQSQGTLLDAQNQGRLNYTAQISDDQLIITLINPQTGQGTPLQFTRANAAALQQNTATLGEANTHNAAKDNRIIGGWLYSDSYVSDGFSFVTQYRLIMNGDGTFWYGDGKVAGGGPGSSVQSNGGGESVAGQWKPQNNNVILVNGGQGWVPMCKYETNGQSLLLYFNDGTKQLFKRTN